MSDRLNYAATFAIFVMVFSDVGCRSRSPQEAAPPAKAESSEKAEKATSDSGEKPDAIDIASDTQRQLGIAVTAVSESALATTLQVPGTVQPNESRVSHVRPLARGRVQAVRVKVGDRVTQGQELAEFDNVEAGELWTQREAARAELARLQAQLTAATRQAERSRKLVEIGAVPQKEYEANASEQQQIEASIQAQQSTLAGIEARLRRFGVQDADSGRAMTTIRSPLGGVVTHVTAAPGEVVDATNELFAVADISRVYVQAQVFEKDLGQIATGQVASIRVDAYPDERFTGNVVAIGDVIDPQTRTAAVRCDVANPKSLLKLDMFATVELPAKGMQSALVVPIDAVQSYEGRSVVFVRAAATRFEVRPVTVGRTVGAVAEVTRGLTRGDNVVTRGAFQVKSALLAKELGEKDNDDKEKK